MFDLKSVRKLMD